MNSDADKQSLATAAAEEILQVIYGDDLAGCTVRPEVIAPVILRTLRQQAEMSEEMNGLYEKAVEAFHLLSTPPTFSAPISPEELRSLLGERLDSIHELTQRLVDAASTLKTRLALNRTDP